jgi:hypothetical protein
MRSLEEIIMDAQKTLEVSIREAFDAGRSHAASELKRRMAALFDDLVSGHVATHREATRSAPSLKVKSPSTASLGAPAQIDLPHDGDRYSE